MTRLSMSSCVERREVGKQAWSVGRRCRALSWATVSELVGPRSIGRVLLVRARKNEGVAVGSVYG